MSLPIEVLYALSGLVVGFVVGLTGVGGGSLMTPLLILLFGIHPATAVGTDLLYAATTKSAGTLVHGFNRLVDWRVVSRLALGSVPAAAITLWVLASTGTQTSGASHALALVLGTMLVLTAISIVLRPQLTRFAGRHRELPMLPQTLLTIATGAALGILVSISSVGAGAIGVTILILLYPKLSTHRIVGSDIAHAVPLTLVGVAALRLDSGHPHCQPPRAADQRAHHPLAAGNHPDHRRPSARDQLSVPSNAGPPKHEASRPLDRNVHAR